MVTDRGRRFLISQNTARPLKQKACTVRPGPGSKVKYKLDKFSLLSQHYGLSHRSLSVKTMTQSSSSLLPFLITRLSTSNTYLSQLIFPPLCSLCFQAHHSQVDIVLHEAHPSIPRPALLIVVAYNVLVVGIWMLCQVPLNQVPCLICCKPEQKRICGDTNIFLRQTAHTDEDPHSSHLKKM